MGTLWMWLACSGAKRLPIPAAEQPTADIAGTWHCIAYVSRAATDPPFTVEGPSDAEAWGRACAKLGEPCAVEAPLDGWSWTRDVDGTGAGDVGRVVLTLTPEPVPFRGEGDASTTRDDACAAAYVQACLEAGVDPGCESAPGFVDGGREAVEQRGS